MPQLMPLIWIFSVIIMMISILMFMGFYKMYKLNYNFISIFKNKINMNMKWLW